MQYMLLIYGNEEGMKSATKEAMGQMFAAYGAYTQAMKKAGAFVSGDPLQPSTTATTVRVADGKTKVLNGPYAETKEQLLGFYLVDCKNLEEALSITKELGVANPGGAYEIRPVSLFLPGSGVT